MKFGMAARRASIILAAATCCAAFASGRDRGEIREALEALLDTRYCGQAMLDGMGPDTAIHGRSPISGDRMFDLSEDEWLPVLLEMTGEELESRKRNLAETVAEIRHWEALGEKRDNSDDEGTRQLWEAHERICAGRARLESMVVVLRQASGSTEQVLRMLERVGKECPPEFDLVRNVNEAMADKACRDGEFRRCLNLGRWYREQYGPGCEEEWGLCKAFSLYGLPALDSEADRLAGYRYLLEFGETLNDAVFARGFDQLAQDVLPGWIGSVQRRRLAERFADEPIPRFRYWDAERQESVEGEIIKSRLPLMLNRQAAAELAAKESELTDLRNVYGNWTKEKTHE